MIILSVHQSYLIFVERSIYIDKGIRIKVVGSKRPVCISYYLLNTNRLAVFTPALSVTIQIHRNECIHDTSVLTHRLLFAQPTEPAPKKFSPPFRICIQIIDDFFVECQREKKRKLTSNARGSKKKKERAMHWGVSKFHASTSRMRMALERMNEWRPCPGKSEEVSRKWRDKWLTLLNHHQGSSWLLVECSTDVEDLQRLHYSFFTKKGPNVGAGKMEIQKEKNLIYWFGSTRQSFNFRFSGSSNISSK